RRAGGGQGGSRDVEGPDRQRELHGVEPDGAGAQHRGGDDRGGQRGPGEEDHGGCEGGDPGAEEHDQHDGGSAQLLRLGGHAGRQGGRDGGEARRAGGGQGGSRDVEGPDRQRQLHGVQPDGPGAQHRGGDTRGRQRAPG